MTFETQEVERNASPALRPQFSAVLSPHLLPWSARRGRTLSLYATLVRTPRRRTSWDTILCCEQRAQSCLQAFMWSDMGYPSMMTAKDLLLFIPSTTRLLLIAKWIAQPQLFSVNTLHPSCVDILCGSPLSINHGKNAIQPKQNWRKNPAAKAETFHVCAE